MAQHCATNIATYRLNRLVDLIAATIENIHKQGQGNQCQTPGGKFEKLT